MHNVNRFEIFYAHVQIVMHNKEFSELAKPFVIRIIVKHTNTNKIIIPKASRCIMVLTLKPKNINQIQRH